MAFRMLVFASSLILLAAGILAGHLIVAALSGQGLFPSSSHVAVKAATSTPAPGPRTISPHPSPTGTSVLVTPTPVPSPTRSTRVRPSPLPTSTPSSPTPTVSVPPLPPGSGPVSAAPAPVVAYYAPPAPTATPGVVTLVNYWIGSKQARPGQTISVDYVIDNGTGVTARLFLGASIKSVHTPSWAAGVISDPTHDVIATVPPGVTIHLRYFTLPSTLRPGLYDVAWGLRDPVSGERVALVAARSILDVMR